MLETYSHYRVFSLVPDKNIGILGHRMTGIRWNDVCYRATRDREPWPEQLQQHALVNCG